MLTEFVKDETSVENNYLNEHIILSKGDWQIKFISDLTRKRIGVENHFIFSDFAFPFCALFRTVWNFYVDSLPEWR